MFCHISVCEFHFLILLIIKNISINRFANQFFIFLEIVFPIEKM